MGVGYNPFTGQLDLLGTGGGGGGPTTATRYTQAFNNTTDWTLNTGLYEIAILATTHGKGTSPQVAVLEVVGLTHQLVNTVIIVDASGNVTVQVTGTPDNRFNGKVLII